MTWTERVIESTESKAVIILGMGPQALYLLREMHGIRKCIFLVGPKSYYVYLSRYGSKICKEDDESIKKTVDILCKEYGKDTPILIGGGAALDFALKHIDDTELNVFPRPFSHLRVLNQKKDIAGWLKSQTQWSDFYLPTYTWSQMPEVTFPVLAKWNSSAGSNFKTKIINNSEDWRVFSVKYGAHSKDLVFQPHLDHNRLYHLGGWFQSGQLCEHVLVEEQRQNPVGMVSYLKYYEGMYSSVIRELIEEILKHYPITGFIQFEFIEDITKKRLYFLECNARPWGSMDALNFRGKKASGSAVHLFKDLSNRHSSAGLTERFIDVIQANILHFRWNDPFPFMAPIINQLLTNDKTP